MSDLRIVSVVGNPKPASRTRKVAERLADVAAGALSDAGFEPASEVLEVSGIGPQLLGWGTAEAAAAVQQLVDADVIVVASPVYKATYTGLLKLLFDQIGAGQLAQSVAVPVMVGGAPNHALAVDVHLRPLLVEVGASCPTAGLYILDSSLESLEEQLNKWAANALAPLVGAVREASALRTVTL